MTARRVSVIVTTTGQPEPLHAALVGLAAQEMPDLDVVVVNDGGPDVQVVVDQAQGVFPTRLITLPSPRGRSVARNVGIGVAAGHYLAFCDEGDFFLPGHLGHLVSVIERSGGEVAYDTCAVTSIPVEPGQAAGLTLEADASGDRQALLRGLGSVYETDYPFDGLMLSVAGFVPVSTVLCRHTGLPSGAALRFNDQLNALEDWELWLRLHQRHRWRFVHSERVGVVHLGGLETVRAGATGRHAAGRSGSQAANAYVDAFHWVTTRYPAVPGSRVARYRGYMANLLRDLPPDGEVPLFAYGQALRALYDGFTGRMAEDAVPVLLTTTVRR